MYRHILMEAKSIGNENWIVTYNTATRKKKRNAIYQFNRMKAKSEDVNTQLNRKFSLNIPPLVSRIRGTHA